MSQEQPTLEDCTESINKLYMRGLEWRERAEKAEAELAQMREILVIAEDDFRYIAEQCESVSRVEGITLQESRTWKVVGRLARESASKLKKFITPSPTGAQK